MPFAIALSGLNAASADLGVTANNVANVNTTGFKMSRAQFSEVFAVGTQSVSSSAAGSGVRLSEIAQQFTQGNIDFTDNALDLAIGGEGFFVISDNGARSYTRAGAFGVDNQGYVVERTGRAAAGLSRTAGNGLFNTGTPVDLQLTIGANPPAATTRAAFGINLPADAAIPANPVFDATDPTSFNHTTSVTMYDSLGAAHTATVYFIKDAAANTWNTEVQIDGNSIGGATPVVFDTDGSLLTPAGGLMPLAAYTPTTGASDILMSLDFGTATQFGDAFGVNSLSQDGFYDRSTDRRQRRLGRRRLRPLYKRTVDVARQARDGQLRQPAGTAAARRHDLGRIVPVRRCTAGRSGYGIVRQHPVRCAGSLQRRPDGATRADDHGAAKFPGERAGDFDGRHDNADRYQYSLDQPIN